MKSTLLVLYTSLLPIMVAAQKNEIVTVQSIIEIIQQKTEVVWPAKTVDTFKAGDPNIEITGIATTFLATMDVLKKARVSGLNLIITHEPTFYNHQDDLSVLGNDNIQAAKKKFIEDNDLVVWRFHDIWHMMQPDGIMTGMVKKMGWEKNQVGDLPGFFEFEKTTLQDFAGQMQKHSPTPIRIIGNPNMAFTKVAAVWGAAGSVQQIEVLQRDDVEVLVIGETREWETVEYVRDASSMGRTKALIILGHANSEEAGMEYCAEWLGEFITDLPIEFIEAGDPFWTPK